MNKVVLLVPMLLLCGCSTTSAPRRAMAKEEATNHDPFMGAKPTDGQTAATATHDPFLGGGRGRSSATPAASAETTTGTNGTVPGKSTSWPKRNSQLPPQANPEESLSIETPTIGAALPPHHLHPASWRPTVSTWDQARLELQNRGVIWQKLEMRGGSWTFQCVIPHPTNAQMNRLFEASASDDLQAVRAVLRQIDEQRR